MRSSRRGRAARQPGGILGLALAGLRRVPGRTVLGALALAVGVCALTLLAAVTFVFHGAVVGTVLGDAVSLRARAVDLAAAIGTVVLGVAAIADVLYLNVRERAGELAILRAAGWSDRSMVTLVGYEGAAIGVLGSMGGAAVGLGLAAGVAGSVPPTLILLAVAAAAFGVVLGGAAAVVPALVLQRQRPATLLAGE